MAIAVDQFHIEKINEFILENDGTVKANPNYAHCNQTARVLFGALCHNIAPRFIISGCVTA